MVRAVDRLWRAATCVSTLAAGPAGRRVAVGLRADQAVGRLVVREDLVGLADRVDPAVPADLVGLADRVRAV